MPPDDRELDEFLAGRSPLSRAWREDGLPEAPPQLDAKVLETAREELRRARAPRRLLRWDGPLALAASTLVVLGLAWVTQSRLEPGQEEQREAVVTAMPESAPPAPMPAAAAAPQRQEEKQEAPALERRKKRPAEAGSGPAAASAKALPPPFGTIGNSTNTPDIAASPPPPASSPAPAPLQPPAEAQDAAAGAMAPAPQQAARDRAAEPEQSVPHPLPSVPAPFPAQPNASMQMAAPAPSSAGISQAYGNMGTARAKAQADPCAAAQRAPQQRQAAPEDRGDPAAWLAQIRALRDAGTAAAARAELACYTARNPGAEIPDDLRSLLPAAAP
jgi:hypothetical protein